MALKLELALVTQAALNPYLDLERKVCTAAASLQQPLPPSCKKTTLA